jgi:hypothetical protein
MIAKELNMTRSAVMGVVNRMIKWGVCQKRGNAQYVRAKKVNPEKVTPEMQIENKISLAPVTVAVDQEPIPINDFFLTPTPSDGKEKTIFDLGLTDCRWMNSKTHYCAKPGKSSIRPWCPEHYKIVYSSEPRASKKKRLIMRKLLWKNMRILKTS